MTTLIVGEDIDIYDVFETDIELAATPLNGQLRFRLEKPDGTLAVNANIPNAAITPDATVSNKYHAEYRVDMPGIWYWDWKPDGNLGAFVQGWFRVIPELIGHRSP